MLSVLTYMLTELALSLTEKLPVKQTLLYSARVDSARVSAQVTHVYDKALVR